MDIKLEVVKEEHPKPKPSGKLDFSKAKPAAPKPAPETRKAEPAESSSVIKAAPKQESKPLKSKDKASFFFFFGFLCCRVSALLTSGGFPANRRKEVYIETFGFRGRGCRTTSETAIQTV
jgi:hypothetical protein